MATKIGELVKRAKGDDRSVREYSRQSGVDPAIISKIINGEYTPKKHEIYSKLTSTEAAPRGGVTFKQLVEAAEDTVSYKAGVAAGAAAVTALLGRLGSIPVAGIIMSAREKEQKSGEEKIKKVQNRISKFVALANGVLFSELAKAGVRFQIIAQKYHDILQNDFDTWLSVEDEKFSEILLRYVYLSEEEAEMSFLVENTARRIVESLVFLNRAADRHVCVLTNCKNAFDYLSEWKGKLSYNGFLSAILVDEENVCLSDEVPISVPDGSDDYTFLTSRGQVIDNHTNRIIGFVPIVPDSEEEE